MCGADFCAGDCGRVEWATASFADRNSNCDTNCLVDGPGAIAEKSAKAKVQDVFVRQQAKNAFETIKNDGIPSDFTFQEIFNANLDWNLFDDLTAPIKACQNGSKKHVREKKHAVLLDS